MTADSAGGAAGGSGDYAQLPRTVKGARPLRRRPVYYGLKIGLNLVLLAAGWTVFAVLGRSWWQVLVTVFLALMFTRPASSGTTPGIARSPAPSVRMA